MSIKVSKKLGHFGENVAYCLVSGLLALCPKSKRASIVGSILAFVGPKIGINKRILRHLKLTMPELSAEQRLAISQQVWRNLGVVYAEMAVGGELAHPETGIVTPQNFQAYEIVRKEGRGAIMIGAHFGNWELSVLYAGFVLKQFMGFYRKQNNPFINDKINQRRTSTGAQLIAKGDRKGLRQAIENLRQGGSVGILMDQHLHGGEKIPFMGVQADTMPLAFSLAQSTGAAVIPYRLKRLKDGTYQSIFEDEVKLPNTGDREEDRRLFLTEINDIMSGWIRQDPGQWFWFHNRWR